MKIILSTSIFLLAFGFKLIAQSKIDSSQIYFENAYIMDFHSNEFRIGSILTKNDIISKITFGKSSGPLSEVINYDMQNRYIIPGLIDTHVHLGTDPSHRDNLSDTEDRLQHLLLNGVTTVRDMAGDTRYLNYLSRSALLDLIPSPDIYFSALFAGPSFFRDPRTKQSAQGVKSGACPWMQAVTRTTDFNRVIAEAKGTGATGIKIYANLDYKIVKKIVKAAHKQEMKVWAHATIFPAIPSEISKAGVDVISHATLLAWEGEKEVPTDASNRYRKLKDFNIDNPNFSKLMHTLKDNKTILDATISVYRKHFPDTLVFYQGVVLAKQAYHENIKIGVGTDMTIDTLSDEPAIIQEMRDLHNEVGMKAIDVIRAATIINAEIIGIEKEVGSITVGKKANFVVLKSNPLINVKNCSDIEYVIKNGKVNKK